MPARALPSLAVFFIPFLAGCNAGDPADSGFASGGTAPPTTSAATTSAATTADTTTMPGDGATTGETTDTASDDGNDANACGNAAGQLLRPDMPWNTDVSAAPTASDSAAVIAYLQANVQSDARFQLDVSIPILRADASTPRMAFTPNDDYFDPDCDPAPVPLPEGGHLEGEQGYTCESGGDCHLIVVDEADCRLYEQWRAGFGPEGGGCLAIWDLDRAYDETLRGDYCGSADGAGLPIAPLLFTADEIAAGEIRHAIRFILPNENIRDDAFVRPGTHAPPATDGPEDAPPYSARLRLRADVDISGLGPAAQVVAEALKTYGMILADGGNITFTAADDTSTAASWDDVGLGPHDLKALQWSDFEVVDAGPAIVWSEGECARSPISE